MSYDPNDMKKILDLSKNIKKQSSYLYKMFEKIKPFWTKLTHMFESVSFLWFYFLGPIWNFFYWITVTIFFQKTFMKVWDKFAYKTDQETGELIFSRKRGAGVILSFLAGLYFLVSIAGFVWDVTLYMTTARIDEIVYLSNAQEILPDDNIFSVQGCNIINDAETISCSVEESLYFRINPNLFSQVWSYIVKGDFFYPDYVAAPIAPGWSRCVITSYGFRLKTLVRRFEIYPELLDANCETLN